MIGDDWTRARLDRLRAYWAEGLTMVEIAERLGVTKGAVAGKVHRLALARRPSPISRSAEAVRIAWRRQFAAGRKDAVMAWFAGLAAQGAPCPSNDAIAEQFGLSSTGKVVDLLLGLEDLGCIARQRANGQRRVIAATDESWSLVSTGQQPIRRPSEPKLPRQSTEHESVAPRPRPTRVASRPIVAGGVPSGVGCRWPMWGRERPACGDHLFCDGPRAGLRPYCAEHCAIAYTRPGAAEGRAAA